MTEKFEVVKTITRADIIACPHLIVVPEHYRENGTCRCDDPAHLQMKGWGYRWHNGVRRWT